MKAIFLDIDGVVCIRGGSELDPGCLQNVVDLVRLTDAKLVITSTWRLIPPSKQLLEDTFKSHGIDIFRFTKHKPEFSRAYEIMCYVDAWKLHGMTNWVILDDTEVAPGRMPKDTTAANEPDITDHFIKIHPRQGFDGQMLVRALQVLNSPTGDES